MSHPVAQRIVRLHPAVLTVFICLGWLAWIGVEVSSPPLPVRGMVMALQFVGIGLWCWAVFTVCDLYASKLRKVIAMVAFVGPAILVGIAGTFGWATRNSPVAAIGLGFFVLGLWFAARAIQKREDPSGTPDFGTVALMLLMYFTIPAFWILRPRILPTMDQDAARTA